MFINLMDVNIDQGPLNIYSKSDTKKFIKLNNYKNRNNYLNQDLKDCLISNTGKIGESLVANTTGVFTRLELLKKEIIETSFL